MFRTVGKYRQTETEKTVSSHLQQHAGQDHGAGGRRLDVSIRQPRVEREHRHLDRKTYKECKEDPPLEVVRQILANRLKRQNVECAAGPELRGYIRVLCR